MLTVILKFSTLLAYLSIKNRNGGATMYCCLKVTKFVINVLSLVYLIYMK